MSLFRERVDVTGCAAQIPLRTHTPTLTIAGLLAGVDNVRHDVLLSPRLMQLGRAYLARLVAEYGDVKELCEDTNGMRSRAVFGPSPVQPARGAETAEFRDTLAQLLAVALTRAKNDDNLCIETACRLAIVKFLRQEMNSQFLAVLEQCRARLRSYEGPRHTYPQKGIELRDRVARFQLAKKATLRKVGQELFAGLRDLEKTALGRVRRSLFGDAAESNYEIFLSRLVFADDARDDLLNAEHYLLIGTHENDIDRFAAVEAVAGEFLRMLGYAVEDEAQIDALLNEPDNAQALFEGGEPSDPVRKAVLAAWVDRLENANLLGLVVAAYETLPILAEYLPVIEPQQLKLALVSRSERKRVESLLKQHGKLSPDSLRQGVRRVHQCRGPQRAKVAARFLMDFMRYHRDLRRWETLNSALDTVNLITSDKLRELSAINHTLYEFLLAEEQQSAEDKVIHHIVLKADIRDSTSLTRMLFERGLNPASYFSLNFYDPINKLLPKYGAQKLFIEGDALILALFEREGEPELGVARACVLAREIIEIVRGYNQQSHNSGLPSLELGIGISYQDTAPMYLMDGGNPIMISPALNASDRLSSCSKSARRFCQGVETVFNVFAFQTIDDADTAGQPEEFLVRYNIGGIVLDEAAFQKLQQEISLTQRDVRLPTLWDEGRVRLYTGTVPVASGIVHNLAVREALVPHIDAREFVLKEWTDRRYYEVCTNAAVYELVGAQSAGA